MLNFVDAREVSLSVLSKVMTPITDKAVQKLKNTYEAKEKLSNIIITNIYFLVSFDVKSLFTSVPHDLVLTCAKKALDSDKIFWIEQESLKKIFSD